MKILDGENVLREKLSSLETLVSPDNILELHTRLNLSNPGYMGEAVVLPPVLDLDIQKMLNQSWETYKFNEFVSSLVPLDRELPDIRTDYCKQLNYSTNLPMASVILVLHNEALSTVLRTVYSVLNRSPESLIREIILVDDCSTLGEIRFLLFGFSTWLVRKLSANLKQPLKEQVELIPKVTLIRSPTRIGLMQARMLGAVNSKGPALVFMDSHVEVTPGEKC